VSEVLLVEDLYVKYYTRRGIISAVSGVTFDVIKGEMLAVVGESGSGKSTLGRVSLRLYKPTAGKVIFDEIDITSLPERYLRKLRKRMQLIPQDPYSSINPFYTIGETLTEPLLIHNSIDRREALEEAARILEDVGLVPADEYLGKRPQHLS
jgi:peptide/nickel transport system ATP-binding protein